MTHREKRTPAGARARDQIIQQDVEDLRRLGYAQQLFREMGGFSNFAISFSIISVLTGAILLYGYGLKFAGPVINSVGWPVVSLFTLCVAASMAELASAYPTAGGLYFWAFRLGGRGWAWLTAWLNMIGQVTITAGINVAAAICLIGAATRILGVPADAAIPGFGSVTSWYFQVLTAPLGHVIALVIGVAMWLCGLASITSMARMWFAFARDDGMPGSGLIKRVSPRYRTPVWSILITSLLAIAICLYAAAYFVVTSISTITLYLAYAIPIFLNWRNRGTPREHTTPATAPWSLGRWGAAINAVALLWVLVLVVIFSLPPNELVLWTVLLVLLVLTTYWWASARRRFRGPAGTPTV